MVETTEAPPPVLSTYQDESTFEFQQYSHTDSNRNYLKLGKIADKNELISLIHHYYCIEETINFIKSHPQCHRITLQFPDELICDSSFVVQQLQEHLHHQSVWALADTSYSPCCVDEVAAEHVDSDLVIHYGDACLNLVNKLTVGYVFGTPVVDLDSIIGSVTDTFNGDDKIMLMADASHSYILPEIVKRLSGFNVAWAGVKPYEGATIIGGGCQQDDKSMYLTTLNRTLHGLEGDVEEYQLFHISKPHAPRLLKLQTMFQSVSVYDTAENRVNQGPFPNLMKRYRALHVARTAGTIGLLVNTLSLANTASLLEQLKQKITKAGKKYYMFVVGKPNVAKLANFELVEVWCILGCDHQGIIIDQNNDYFKPIITPFELVLSLQENLTWTGKWETNFKILTEELAEENEVEEGDVDSQHNDDSDAPEFNAVTGTFTSTSRPLRQKHLEITAEEDQDEESAVVNRISSSMVLKDTVSTAAMHLQNRTWKGLGTEFEEGESEGAALEEGISGVARGYDK